MSPSSRIRAKALAATVMLAAVVGLGAPRAVASTAPTVQWTAAQPGSSPPALGYASAAFDADNHTVVLFGGATTAGNVSGDTWVWNGRTWTRHSPSSNSPWPPPRELASMAFDPSLHQLILFGGRAGDGALLSDTWAWNGVSWIQLDQGVTNGPPAREGAALAFDATGNLVLFGGTGYVTPPSAPSTTTASATSSSTTTTTAPVAQLTGERVLSDTWTWNGKSWVASTASGPSARWGAAMTYDSANRTTVLFSGETALAQSANPTLATDTWTWNGKGWSRQKPATSPPPRFESVFSDSPTVNGALLLDGDGTAGALADAWLWSAGNWVQAQMTGSPTARVGAAGAFDAARSETTVFGGIGGGGVTLSDTDLVTASFPAPAATSTSTTTTAASRSSTPSTQRPSTTTPARSGTTLTVPTTLSKGTGTEVSLGAGVLSLQVSLHTVRAGGLVQLSGTGFKPDTDVVITFASSPPVVVGHSHVGGNGAFTASVTVPAKAQTGTHHFEASGVTAEGNPAQLATAVFVSGAKSGSGPSGAMEAIMISLAVLIPALAWLTMNEMGRRRRRRPAD